MELQLIISRYLFREVIFTLLALTILLLLIYISHRFMSYLVQASVGNLPAQFILQLLGLRLLSDLTLILPLSFFLALLLALGRLYKDNEITAMAACGIPVPILSIVSLATIFAIFIAILSLVAGPWAEKQRGILEVQLSTVAEVGGIAAGRFKEFNHGKGIFYVKDIDAEKNIMSDLFIQLNLEHKQVIMVAKRGYQIVQNGELFIVLMNGNRYERQKEHLNYTITQFSEHRIRVPRRLNQYKGEDIEGFTTQKLWFSEELALQAELQWRISLPLSVILLAILAVPLSHTNPRQGQYSKILLGILTYLIYNNLLNVAKKWIERGDIPPIIGIWWVHFILIAIILVLFHLAFFKELFYRGFNLIYSLFLWCFETLKKQISMMR
ncbi:MAG: LPS export ABC transporter permease LptF [Thiomargarita sp.]|nr:LPS export ABC transporter permease LptF [Thiomargarita sp.]